MLAISLHILAAILYTATARAGPVVTSQTRQAAPHHNDFSCRSNAHPNPVVLIHGLGATYYEDVNQLEAYLKTQGFCTFSTTYGAYPQFPFAGGLKPIQESSLELADFIRQVHSETGAAKVDLVGHSEGAFQALYVPKFQGVAGIVQRIVSIAPPTHGTSFANLYTLSYLGGGLTNQLVDTILDTVGCQSCTDLVDGGAAVQALTNGSIVQPGNQVTIVTSKYDELVTPPETSFVREPGVENLYVQDYCPFDPVGHIGEAYDVNVWAIVRNRLSDSKAGPTVCLAGFPGR